MNSKLALNDRIIRYFEKEQIDAEFSIQFSNRVGKNPGFLKQLLGDDKKLKDDVATKLKRDDRNKLKAIYTEMRRINIKIADGQDTEKHSDGSWKSDDKAEGKEEMRLFAEENLSEVTRILKPD